MYSERFQQQRLKRETVMLLETQVRVQALLEKVILGLLESETTPCIQKCQKKFPNMAGG